MTNSLDDAIQRIVASMDNEQNNQEQEQSGTSGQEKQPEETIHIHYFPDAIVILKEDENTAQVIDSTPVTPQKISFLPAYALCGLYLIGILATLAFQLSCIVNPPIATVTIIPQSQTVTLTGTLQVGRVVAPLTISQSQTTPTTGKGHQSAQAATGYLTFYNGLFTSQTISQGTILTGSDGIQIITDQDASIPAANPPIFGQVTVSAHTINAGRKGNIPAYDINQACCANAVLAKNTQSFIGGADERIFQTVSKNDIHTVVSTLKPQVMQSMRGALQGRLNPTEQLYVLPCTPTQTSNHRIGEEARAVTLTISETCSAVAYNSQELETKATDLLSRQAVTKIGANYNLFGTVKVRVTQATITHTPAPLVFLSFQATGTWLYALTPASQQQINNLIAGATKPVALAELLTFPGVAHAAIAWGDDSKLPKDTRYIHIVFVIGKDQ